MLPNWTSLKFVHRPHSRKSCSSTPNFEFESNAHFRLAKPYDSASQKLEVFSNASNDKILQNKAMNFVKNGCRIQAVIAHKVSDNVHCSAISMKSLHNDNFLLVQIEICKRRSVQSIDEIRCT